ncbi:MAG: hypothetical protein AB7I35_16060 [Ramlibacter sp.]
MKQSASLPRGISPGLELGCVVVLAATAFFAIPLSLGEMGLSWDALNHHIYLGWTAEAPRFDLDVLAASYQSYQFPYLYWPVYKIATSGLDGREAGVVLALLHLLAVPPVWMIARCCISGQSAFDAAMRIAGVILAFLSGVILSLFDSTANDLLAAIPFVWALAWAMIALQPEAHRQERWRLVLAAGFLAGVSIAFKLSNAPLCVVFPILWGAAGRSRSTRMAFPILGGLTSFLGFIVIYGYWGWQLWLHFGNPVFPYAHSLFEPLREMSGWHP